MLVPWFPSGTDSTPRFIGMVHLRPLPGSPRFAMHRGAASSMRAVLDAALADAAILVEGGVDGLMIENFGDGPFFADRVPAITIAAISRVVETLKSRFDVPLGVNVLRNDGLSALEIAIAGDCSWIRVNVLTGTRLGDQGLLHGMAADLLRRRSELQPPRSLREESTGSTSTWTSPSKPADPHARFSEVAIWADLKVKHSMSLGEERPLVEEAEDLVSRSLADAIVLSGRGSGRSTNPKHLEELRSALPNAPILIGSGVSVESVDDFRQADGLIVGTSLKANGAIDAPIDPQRVQRFVQALRG